MREEIKTRQILAGVAVALCVALLILLNMPSFASCRANAPTTAGEHWFQATQVVVQPWMGPHHVYGVFKISEKYKFHHLYSNRLIIDGVRAEFSGGSPEDENVDLGSPGPGFYLKLVYIPTRDALWLLMTGRFGELGRLCHWWLVFVEKAG